MTRRRLPSRLTAGVLALLLGVGVAPGCSKDDRPTGTRAELCRELRRVVPLESVVSGARTSTASEIRARADEARTAYHRLVDAAPPDIDDEVRALVRLVDRFLDAVDAHPTDPTAAAAAIRRATRAEARAGRSARAVVGYARRHCQLDLDPSADPGGAPPETTVPGNTLPDRTDPPTTGP